MGVRKNFWSILQPCARIDRSSDCLVALRGQKLAIDLSHWICQMQTVSLPASTQSRSARAGSESGQSESTVKRIPGKPHLRNLFFRIVKLVAKVGSLPVMVIDGNPPLLKRRFANYLSHGVSRGDFSYSPTSSPELEKEGDSQIGKGQARLCKPSGDRSQNERFLRDVAEAVELLDLLGLPILFAKGEAEALCAELNRHGDVDACVTGDSDALLYGAERVIKVLLMNDKEPCVEAYYAQDIQEKLGLGRNHLIAIALLLGCDFNDKGVKGVGPATSLKLVKAYTNDEILETLSIWGSGKMPSSSEMQRFLGSERAEETVTRANTSMNQEEPIARIARPRHCSNCGHRGDVRKHILAGCESCKKLPGSFSEESGAGCIPKPTDFICNCEWCSAVSEARKQARREKFWDKIFKNIVCASSFFDQGVVDLFLEVNNDHFRTQQASPCSALIHCSSFDIATRASTMPLIWRLPDVEMVKKFLAFHLHWTPKYTEQKLFPMLAHLSLLQDTSSGSNTICLESPRKSCSIDCPVMVGRYKLDSICGLRKHRRKYNKQCKYILKWVYMENMRQPERAGDESPDDNHVELESCTHGKHSSVNAKYSIPYGKEAGSGEGYRNELLDEDENGRDSKKRKVAVDAMPCDAHLCAPEVLCDESVDLVESACPALVNSFNASLVKRSRC